MNNIKGILIVMLIILFVILCIIEFRKDSRALIVEKFERSKCITIMMEENRVISCDSLLKNNLIKVLGTLQATRYPTRSHCSVLIIRSDEVGTDVIELRLLTTTIGNGLFSMAGENNYTSVHIDSLLFTIETRFPGLKLRYFDENGRCDR